MNEAVYYNIFLKDGYSLTPLFNKVKSTSFDHSTSSKLNSYFRALEYPILLGADYY